MAISTRRAAEELGISQVRVRELLQAGALKGERVGRSWTVDEASVYARRQSKPQAGRPRKDAAADTAAERAAVAEACEAHALYTRCKALLSGCYDAGFLDFAQTEEERSFYTGVADFFLQRRQRELIEAGVY